MALDPTPWFVSQPGAEHSSEVARTLAFAATHGESGVTAGNQLDVVAQAAPNNTVRVLPGTAAAVSTYPGDSGQSYILRNSTATDVTIESTGSSGGRVDAIVLRVDDTGRAGQAPTDPTNFDYTKIQVIQGVPANLKYAHELNLNFPFVLLARINMPANTIAVTDAYITDLRYVIGAREKTVSRSYHLTTGQQTHVTRTDVFPVGQAWPQTATMPVSWRTIRVPEWARRQEVTVEWHSINVPSFSGNGQVWITFGLEDGDTGGRIQPSRWSSEDTTQRQHLVAFDTVPVHHSWRGKDLIYMPRARRMSTPSNRILLDQTSAVRITVRYQEQDD